MNHDDDPHNNGDDVRLAPWVRGVVIVIIAALLAVVAFQIVASVLSRGAAAQGYLPPQRYVDPRTRQELPEPVEYYAEDWIVLDPKGRTVCAHPYVRKDVKIVQCVSDEKVR